MLCETAFINVPCATHTVINAPCAPHTVIKVLPIRLTAPGALVG
jgi:hypothetical protein